MCRDTPLFNFDLDVLAADLNMIAPYWDYNCGDFRPWRLILIIVVQNIDEKRVEQKIRTVVQVLWFERVFSF